MAVGGGRRGRARVRPARGGGLRGVHLLAERRRLGRDGVVGGLLVHAGLPRRVRALEALWSLRARRRSLVVLRTGLRLGLVLGLILGLVWGLLLLLVVLVLGLLLLLVVLGLGLVLMLGPGARGRGVVGPGGRRQGLRLVALLEREAL